MRQVRYHKKSVGGQLKLSIVYNCLVQYAKDVICAVVVLRSISRFTEIECQQNMGRGNPGLSWVPSKSGASSLNPNTG